MDYKDVEWEVWTGQVSVAGCCEHGYEPASSGQAAEAWEPADSQWRHSVHFLQTVCRELQKLQQLQQHLQHQFSYYHSCNIMPLHSLRATGVPSNFSSTKSSSLFASVDPPSIRHTYHDKRLLYENRAQSSGHEFVWIWYMCSLTRSSMTLAAIM